MTNYKKFNFMFFILNNDFYKTILLDAAFLTNFRAMSPIPDNLDNVKKVTFAPLQFSNNPLAFNKPENYLTWSNHIFEDDFPVKLPMCFVFYETFYSTLKPFNFFQFLRENYPSCKLVLWLNNPIYVLKKVREMFVDEADTKEILSTFDCVITYNKFDAIDYGLTYFEGPYSVLPFEQPQEDIDIFFVGLAKDRLEKILRAYETFKAAGFTCNFYINGITSPLPATADGLHFNHMLSYIQVLKQVLRSKAVLDITQSGTYGLTMRYFESLAYDKNFITDNPFYRQERFSSPKLFLIDKSYDINKKQFMNAAELSNNYRNEYSPLRMISFLESVLNS